MLVRLQRVCLQTTAMVRRKKERFTVAGREPRSPRNVLELWLYLYPDRPQGFESMWSTTPGSPPRTVFNTLQSIYQNSRCSCCLLTMRSSYYESKKSPERATSPFLSGTRLRKAWKGPVGLGEGRADQGFFLGQSFCMEVESGSCRQPSSRFSARLRHRERNWPRRALVALAARFSEKTGLLPRYYKQCISSSKTADNSARRTPPHSQNTSPSLGEKTWPTTWKLAHDLTFSLGSD